MPYPPQGASKPRPVRFDPEALYQAVDKRRRELRISHREVLRRVGLGGQPSVTTRLGHGLGINADNLVALLAFLETTDMGPFIRRTDDEVTS